VSVNGEYLAALDDARRSAADGAQQLPQNLLMQMRPQATTPHIEMRTQETVRARAACSRVDECCRARQFRERIAAQLVQQQRSTIQPQQQQQQQQQVQMSALMSAPVWNRTSSWSSSTTAQPSSMSLSELTQLQQTLSQQGATQSLNLPLGEVHGVLPAMTPAMSSAGSKRVRLDDISVPKRRAVERALDNDDDDGDVADAQEQQQMARIRAAMADPAQMARMLSALQS
jgi:hypothetical protein